MNARRCALVVLLMALAAPTAGRSEEQDVGDGLLVSIVPRPVHVERREGSFAIDGHTHIAFEGDDDALPRLAAFLAAELRRETGRTIPVGAQEGRRILLTTKGASSPMSEEGYRLRVSADGVSIAGRPAGVFYGIQSLRQLLQDGRFPAVHIEDRPRFPWRGLHLDVGRHFFSASDVKRYLDALAFFKMNRFHWHLTEDQGWRIEIRRYHKLTSVGSKRDESPKPGKRTAGDGTPHGGYYTQEEVQDVVRYAADRFITIVPEIEMPGHAQAAIAAYPWLGNLDEQLPVHTRWGVSKHVFNVEEETFEFLENVLAEVIDLFPGEFVHIGGDECPKDEWKASKRAQARIRSEGLKDEHELQSYFIRRIERFLRSKGRRMIGWDEIQEGGLAPGAAMMVWRNRKYGVDAVKQGHDVVMSPTSHCYFDYYQGARDHEPEAIGGFLPLERVYAFEPIPEGLTAAQAKHVLGGQGNLWTEYMRTLDHVFYMAYPRGAALAEVLWSPKELRDVDDFLRRWPSVATHLDRLGVNYRLPPPEPLASALISRQPVEVGFEAPPPGQVIVYTLDGSLPRASSTRYAGPIRVESTGQVTAAIVTSMGRRSAPVTVDVVRWEPPQAPDPGSLVPGLRVAAFLGEFSKVPDFADLVRLWTAEVRDFAYTGREPENGFALCFSGFFRADEPGVRTFTVGSDDGSVLKIAGATVVSNDGLHGFARRTGRVHLSPGVYPIELGYFEAGGAQRLEVVWEGGGTLHRSVTQDR